MYYKYILFCFCLYFIINMSLCSSNSHLCLRKDLFILFSSFRPRNPATPANYLFRCNFLYLLPFFSLIPTQIYSVSLTFTLSYSLSLILAFHFLSFTWWLNKCPRLSRRHWAHMLTSTRNHVWKFTDLLSVDQIWHKAEIVEYPVRVELTTQSEQI